MGADSVRLLDVEDVPVKFGPGFACERFDTPKPEDFPPDTAMRNGVPISQEEFDALVIVATKRLQEGE